MSATEMARQEWMLAHFVAANLALKDVSKNLVLSLQEYLARHPGDRPDHYLAQLVRLDDAFAGGQDEQRQRQELYKVVRKAAGSAPETDWPLVLAWAARLMVAYRPEERGRVNRQQEKDIQTRIQKEFKRAMKQLEEPYYG